MKFLKYFGIFLLIFIACTPLKQANTLYESGDYRQTISICKTALLKDSTNTDAMKLIADSYMKLKNLDSSYVFYKDILSYLPDDAVSKEKVARILAVKGDSLYQKNDYYKAIEQYKDALSYDPNSTLIIKKIAESYLQAGRHEDAKSWYEKIINSADSVNIAVKLNSLEQSKDKASEHLHSGIAFKKKKQYRNAMKEIDKALELKPDYKEAKYQKYMVTALPLYRKGDKNGLWDAIVAFGYASALFPERAEPHYYMGMSYNKKDRDEYDNAISEFELVLKTEPEGEFAQEAKGKISELKKRKKKMQEFLSH